jgi:signal peptidase I
MEALIALLSWLALPVVLVWLYDMFVLAPKRPRLDNGEAAPGPQYTRIAGYLVVPVIVAVIYRIGVAEVFAWAKEVAVPLSWAAVPVGILCGIDSWLFAPYRLAAIGPVPERDPLLMRAAYAVLPVLVVAVIVRMISAETLDFSLVLLLLSLATGLVWLVDHFVFQPKRDKAAYKGPGGDVALPEPGTVDYARSFFPVAFIVLVVRAFIFEPFRIPSDSMMPTLLDGDFIVVNKFAYGLRLPVVNEKFISTGMPQRGDVVVFRKPGQENVNYIKRLVGLPGDRIEVHDDQLVVNGEKIAQAAEGAYNDGCYIGLRLSTETLGEHTHQVMSCRSPNTLLPSLMLGRSARLPTCNRKSVVERSGNYICDESLGAGSADRGDHVFEVVPPGHYLMIGDNRDNSEDSRVWGLVPDKNLVGKATRIWFNFDPQRSPAVNFGRIGNGIQ